MVLGTGSPPGGDAVMIAVARRFGNKRSISQLRRESLSRPGKARHSAVTRSRSQFCNPAVAPRSVSALLAFHSAHAVLGIGRAHAVAVQIHLLEDLGLDLVGRAHRGVAGRQEDAHPA